MNLNKMTFEKKDGIGWARFNRPEKLNALNDEVFSDIGTIVEACEADDEVKVLVITGSDKVFAAGADIDGMANGSIKDAFEMTDRGIPVTERLADMAKPTIAAISGYALGGGLEVALCCDFRIADDTAMVGLPEINLGIIPGGGGTQRLPRLINPSKALELIMTGEIIDAQKALDLGILNHKTAKGELESTVSAFAKKLMARPSMGIRAAKAAVRKGLNTSLKDGIVIEQDLFCMLFGTQDQKEGMGAFLEKRRPEFKGC